MAVGDLTAALGDEDDAVRFAAARALIRIGEDPAAPLKTLAALVAYPPLLPERRFVVEAMISAGAAGEAAAVREVARMLADPEEDLRLDAVDALPSLGGFGIRVLPSLEPLWASSDPRVRFTTALAALQLIAPGQTPDARIAPEMEAAVLDASQTFSLRDRALGALYTVAPASLRRCGRGLARQLDLDDLNARLAAAELLHRIDPETLAGKGVPPAGQ